MPSTQQTVREWSRLQGYAWGIAGLMVVSAFGISKMFMNSSPKKELKQIDENQMKKEQPPTEKFK